MHLLDQRPSARTDGLLVEDLDGEVLVYDPKTHTAHCLNPAAAHIWRMSDGRTTVEAMVARLGEVGLPPDDAVAWMALHRLHKARLVAPLELPRGGKGFSRKEVLRVLGAAAAMTLLLPAVDSVVAPLAAQAASCLTAQECRSLRPPNCTGLPVCGTARCCVQVGGGRRARCRPRIC